MPQSSGPAQWKIEPDDDPHGARLHTTATGGPAGTTTLSNPESIWISPGTIATNYTLTATYPNEYATNIYDTAQIHTANPKIISIDPLLDINKPLHHTDLYKTNALVVRRADAFAVTVELSAMYDNQIHDISFHAVDTFNGVPMTNDIPVSISDLDNMQWFCKFISSQKTSTDTVLVEMEIHLPANNCPIGEYKFFAQTTHKDRTMPIVDEKCFPVDVIILFNPWNSNDFVHLTSDTERQEYVMNQNGLIWMGRDVHNKIAKNWRYGQFEDDALSVLLSELQATSGATVVNTLDRQTRAIPSRVARHLAARVNSNDGGILQGNWSPDFSGGTSPFDWRGSPQILSQYKRTGNAVKYGQCWVFAGTLTTLLRCSGIPSRPVTNYMSGHDTNGDGILDIAFDHNGNFYPAKSKDSIWNYHVWSEAWMQRARGIGHSGWQVVDATPQEKSDGTFQCGPAAVSAIKQNLGGIFDVTFVRAEINALTRIDHYLSPSIYSCIQYTERHDYVGKDVSTKSIGNNSREDITSNYK